MFEIIRVMLNKVLKLFGQELLEISPESDRHKGMESRTKNQYLAGVCVNLLSLTYGFFCGWPSPSLPLLVQEDSILLDAPLTNEEASWVGSTICVGGLMGTLVFGFAAKKFGRKVPLLSIAFIQIASLLMIEFASNSWYLIAARIVGGVSGGGIFVVLPVFIGEISEDRNRGFLGSFLVFFCNFGILGAYVLGAYLDYHLVPWVVIPLPVIFFVAFLRFPETPMFLMNSNRVNEAEESIKFYRCMEDITPALKSELHLMKPIMKDDMDSKISMKDFSSKSAKKAVLIGVVLMALNQWCGCFAMLNYTATIFAEAGSSLSPNLSAIVVAVIQIFGACFSTLVDRVGRKILLTVSAFGTSIGLAVLGTYTFLKTVDDINLTSFTWVPLASFSFTIFIVSWGVLTLPFLVLSEIAPQKTKELITSLCMCCLWVFAFLAIKYLSIIIELLKLHGTFFLFSVNSLLGALFIVYFLPETKGRSFNEIIQLLEK